MFFVLCLLREKLATYNCLQSQYNPFKNATTNENCPWSNDVVSSP